MIRVYISDSSKHHDITRRDIYGRDAEISKDTSPRLFINPHPDTQTPQQHPLGKTRWGIPSKPSYETAHVPAEVILTGNNQFCRRYCGNYDCIARCEKGKKE